MNITKSLSVVLSLTLLLLIGCKNSIEPKSSEKTKSLTREIAEKSKKALDWVGTYFGMIPCDSCPGYNTMISLFADGSYEKTIEQIESNEAPKTTRGKINWNDKNRLTIDETTFLLSNNKLMVLDKEQKVYAGALANVYALTKTDLQPALDDNDGYSLQLFKGSDNKNYNLVFNTNPKPPTVLIETEGRSIMLTQSSAWAKGAEYVGNNAALRAQGDHATLVVEGQKIELHSRD